MYPYLAYQMSLARIADAQREAAVRRAAKAAVQPAHPRSTDHGVARRLLTPLAGRRRAAGA